MSKEQYNISESSCRVTISIPFSLKESLAEGAKNQKMSFSAYIARRLAEDAKRERGLAFLEWLETQPKIKTKIPSEEILREIRDEACKQDWNLE